MSKSPKTPAITRAMNALGRASGREADAAYALIHAELRRLAARELHGESARCTLHPTVLVNEAFARLMEAHGKSWENRAHFYGSAARAMRQILVEDARRRSTKKRGGDRARRPLADVSSPVGLEPSELLNLDEALNELALRDEQAARLVMLRFFAGLSVEETARVMGISERTVKREWACARAWLFRRLGGGGESS